MKVECVCNSYRVKIGPGSYIFPAANTRKSTVDLVRELRQKRRNLNGKLQ